MKFEQEENRIVLYEKGDSNEQGYVLFQPYGGEENTLTIASTFVNPKKRGKGYAGMLLQQSVDYARGSDKKLVPVCDYAVTWFERHPEATDVLADFYKAEG